MNHTIWTNVELNVAEEAWLREKVSPHELRIAEQTGSNLEEGKGDAQCRTSTILFGQPAVDDLLSSEAVEWMHITSAGYTRYDRADVFQKFVDRKATFTNSSSVYNDPCAEHLLAFMLCNNRLLLPSILEHGKGHQWIYPQLRPDVRILKGQTVLIVGYGAIARRLTELLQPFGVEIRAIRRSPKGNEPVPTFAISELAAHLPWADHIVNILPASPSTDQLFRAELFAAAKPGAAFYNVGRGDTVVQSALIDALESKHLSCAYLDVTSPEPLPSDHPLWSTPNCVITPHIAGGMQNEKQVLLDHFVANFQRFIQRELLHDPVLPAL